MTQQVRLIKRVYDKNQYRKVIDTSFTQLVSITPLTGSISEIALPSVTEFFEYYNQLFFDIPKLGEVNSHEYLIKSSQEYIGTSTAVNDEIQALIDEVTELRQENLNLQTQLLEALRLNNG